MENTQNPHHQQPEKSSSNSPSESGKAYIQSFRLIDSILPFEVCLYYQIVPLSLEESTLKLGMVNPKDQTALDYIRKILNYFNCEFKAQQIHSQNHHAILTAYLNYKRNTKETQPEPEAKIQPEEQKKPLKKEPEIEHKPPVELPPKTEHKATQNSSLSINEQPTLIVDQQDIASLRKELAAENQLTADNRTQNPKLNPDLQKQVVQKIAEKKISIKEKISQFPRLEITPEKITDPSIKLKDLPNKRLLQNLLGQVLTGGIGRLYFERTEQEGRILWTKDGVLQSVIDGLNLEKFQGLINEIKNIAKLPFNPIKETKQIEIERIYQEEHLMLILRLIPGKYGEESTIQVLRGAALKFHQQQQITKYSEEAMNMLLHLQRKLTQIRDRALFTATPLHKLPIYNQLIDSLEYELQQLKTDANALDE